MCVVVNILPQTDIATIIVASDKENNLHNKIMFNGRRIAFNFNPTIENHQTNEKCVYDNFALKSNDSNNITISVNPTDDNHVTRKKYVDLFLRKLV